MNTDEEYKYLNKYLQYLIKNEGFSNNCSVKIEPVTIKGEGFLGKIFFLTLKEKEKCLNLVIKSALQDEIIRKEFGIKQLFSNEIKFYNTIYPAIKSFEKKLSVTNPLTCVAKYYGCSLDDGTETLGLENLKLIGYELFNKKLVFDDNHVKLVFQNYARYHGTSFAYLNKKPEEFRKITDTLYNINEIFANGESFQRSLKHIMTEVHDIVKELNNPKMLHKFEEYVNNSGEVFANCIKYYGNYKTLLHGDCWSNNMMFKYDIKEGQKVPVDIKLLDFQLIVCSTPVYDLSYSFYSSASKRQFDKLDHFLQIYYDSLSARIKELGSDPEELYPMSELKKEWKQYAKYGFIMGLMITRMKLIDNDVIPDLTDFAENQQDDSIFFEAKFEKKEFADRIKNLVTHCYETGVL